MPHPWYWLTNNAVALQAVGTLASLPLLFYAGWFARRAAQAAEAQVKAAEAATQLSEQLLIAARETATAEREHSLIIKRQGYATLKPVLVFTSELVTGSVWDVYVKNDSATAIAMNLEIHIEVNGNTMVGLPGATILGPGAKTKIHGAKLENCIGARMIATFKSNDGRKFETVAYIQELDRFVQTSKRLLKRPRVG